MIGAVQLGLSLDESLADALEERIERVEEPGAREPGRPVTRLVDLRLGKDLPNGRRHVTRERLEHRRHAEFALACEDAAFEGDVAVDPARRQWTAQSVNVAHPSPGQVRRPHEEVGDHLFAEAQVAQRQAPGCFLSGG